MFENLSTEEREEISYFLSEMGEAHLQMLYAVHGLRAIILRGLSDSR